MIAELDLIVTQARAERAQARAAQLDDYHRARLERFNAREMQTFVFQALTDDPGAAQ